MVAIALAVVAALVAFGALADTTPTCSPSGGAQYDQYGNLLPPCPDTSSTSTSTTTTTTSSGGSQYGQYGGSGGSQYGQYGGGSGGAQYGQYGSTPAAWADDQRTLDISPAPGVDSVAAGDVFTDAVRGWRALILASSGTVSGPQISIDGSTETFTPAVSFPASIGPAPDLTAPNGQLDLDTLNAAGGHQVDGVTASTGFDLSRNVTPSAVPAGTSTTDVTVSVTPQDNRYANGFLELQVNADGSGFAGGSIDTTSVVLPSLGDGETLSYDRRSSTSEQWGISDPVVGKTYTLTLQVSVTNSGAGAAAYEPQVDAWAGSDATGPSTSSATSTSIADSLLGGTISYQAATPTDWTTGTGDVTGLHLALVQPPSPPEAEAQDQQLRSLDLGSSTDSIAAGDTGLGQLGWLASIGNTDTTTVPSAQISLDQSSQTFTPSVTFPLGAGPTDLAQSQALSLDAISGNCCSTSAVQGVSMSTGYDASRSFDTTTIPAGGGDENVTVSITPQDSAYTGGWVTLEVGADWYGGSAATIDASSIATSTLTGGEFAGPPWSGDNDVQWQVDNVQPGSTYTLSLKIHVDNPGSAAVQYKPMVILHASQPEATATPAAGTSTTIADSLLGGTFTFEAGAATDWTTATSQSVETNFEPVQVPSYAVAVDAPEVTVNAGGTFTENATATPTAGFSGDVTLFLSGGPDASGNPTPWPNGFYEANGQTWPTLSIGPDPATGSIGIQTDASLTPGDYAIDLGSYSSGAGPITYTPILVHVLAPLPEADVSDTQTTEADLPSGTDSVAAGDALTGWRGWGGLIHNGDATAAIPDAEISLDGTTQTFTPSAGSFPKTVSSASVAPGDELSLDALNGLDGNPQVQGVGFSTGYDVSRSMSPATVPSGGGTQTLTLSVTPQAPSLSGGSLEIAVSPSDPNGQSVFGATIDTSSVVFPVLGGGEFLSYSDVRQQWVDLGISNVVVGHTYTLTLNLNVPAATGTYEPWVSTKIGVSGDGASGQGTSYSFADPSLGGTFTFSSSASRQWYFGTWTSTNLTLAAAIPATPPTAHAGVDLDTSISLGGSVDSIRATDAYPGALTWNPYILNVGQQTLTAPQISVDTSSQAFAPAVTFPYSEGPGTDLGPYDSFFLNGLGGPPVGSSVPVSSTTAGVDASRSFDTTTIPVGGGDQNVTVTVTPRTSPGRLGIAVIANALVPGATIDEASVVPPAADPNGAQDLSVAPDGSSAQWSLGGSPALGTSYTMTLRIHVPNSGWRSVLYKPEVLAGLTTSTQLGAGPPGPSTTIYDPVLGGTFTFDVGNTDTEWSQRYLITEGGADFAPLDTQVFAVDHFGVHAPASVQSGVPFTLTLTALNASGGLVQNYTGPVAISDASGTIRLVSAVAWSRGTGNVQAVVGSPYVSDTIDAADAGGSPAATGSSGLVQVIGPLDHFGVQLSTSSLAAGGSLQVTLTALDAVGHTVSYAGPVLLSDLSGSLSVTNVGTWLNGSDTATVGIGSAYRNDVITAADESGLTSAAGSSGYLTVLGPVDHFLAILSATSVAQNSDDTLTVSAKDSAGNTVPYGGPVVLSDDLGGGFAPDGTLTFSGGVGQVPLKFTGLGRDRIHVVDNSGLLSAPSGISNAVSIYGPVDHLDVSVAPNSVAQNADTTLTVTARDALGNVVPAYAGPVALTDLTGTVVTDGPPPAFSGGVLQEPVVVSLPQQHDTITVTDASGLPGPPAGTSNVLNVTGPVTHFGVYIGSSSVGVGAGQAFTVTALDALGDLVTGYAGSVSVTDANAAPPTLTTPVVFSGGFGSGAVQIATATRSDRLTVIDPLLGASGRSAAFNVFGPVASFVVRVSPTTSALGTTLTATVTALDALGDTVSSYLGTVSFADSSGQVSGPLDQSWSAGVGRAHFALTTRKTYDRLTASDGGTSGTSNLFSQG